MPSLFDAATNAAMLERAHRLTPGHAARWGHFTVSAMVCHVTLGLRNALGEFASAPQAGPMARWPVNWLVIHVVPWPAGKAVSPPEFLTLAPAEWSGDRQRLEELIARFGRRGPTGTWPISPAFGRITAHSWGVLQYRHLDHHFRQFGA